CFISSFLCSTATTSFLRCFFHFTFTLTIDIIKVNQFDQCHFSIITSTGTELNDTCITTRTTSYLFSNSAEQFSDRFFILQITEYNTTLMSSICFAFCNKWLYIYTQSFCFCNSCYNSLVGDQSNCKITKQRVPVGFC